MKSKIAIQWTIILIFSMNITNGWCQSVFQHSYGDTLFDEAYAICLTSDTSYVLAGYSNSFNTNEDVYLIKTNKNGNLTWSKSIDILGHERAYSVLQDNDTAVYYAVTGDTRSENSDSSDVFLMFIAANGNPYQIKVFGDTSYDDHARCVVRTYDDAFLIVGYTDHVCSNCGNTDIYLIKTDLAGNLIWAKNIDIRYGNDYGMKLLVDSNKYIITGYTWQENKKYDAFLMETSLDGAVNWVHTYGDTAEDYSFSVIKSDTGYTLAGHTYSYDSNTDPDVFVVRTTGNGTVIWKTKYDSKRNKNENYARDLVYYRNNYYLTGYADVVAANTFDLSLIKLDNNGLMQWQRGFGGNQTDQGFGMIRHNNRVVMAGLTYSSGNGNSDAFLVKTDLNGKLDCHNLLSDTNTTYLDSTYGTPSSGVTEVEEERDVEFSWVSPTSNDSICYFDTIPHDTTRYAFSQGLYQSNGVLLFPNPQKSGSSVQLLIKNYDNEDVDATLYNAYGGSVKQTTQVPKIGGNLFRLDIPVLSSGIYFIRVTFGSRQEIIRICLID